MYKVDNFPPFLPFDLYDTFSKHSFSKRALEGCERQSQEAQGLPARSRGPEGLYASSLFAHIRIMSLKDQIGHFLYFLAIVARGFASKSFWGQICGHCLRRSTPSSSSYQGRPPPPHNQCSSFVWLLRKWAGAEEKSLVFSCSRQQWTISGGDPSPSLFNKLLIANFPIPNIFTTICSLPFQLMAIIWNATLN